MSTRINTNTTAVMASRNLDVNSDREGTDIQRLSTGMRINSAADDAAGLVISQNMNAQIVGLTAATSNTNDAINEVKTAEGALSEVQSLLMSMRQLAVNASNQGVNDSTDVSADQAQIQSAIQSINRISGTTQFGNKKLLDGSATSATTITAGSATVSGSDVTLSASGKWNAGNSFNYSKLTVSDSTATTAVVDGKASDTAKYAGKITVNGAAYDLGSSGVDLAAVNTVIQSSGYSAAVSGGKLTFTSTTKGVPGNPQSVDVSADRKSVV